METITRQVRATKEAFKELKILAAMNDLSMGEMLEKLIEQYKFVSKERQLLGEMTRKK